MSAPQDEVQAMVLYMEIREFAESMDHCAAELAVKEGRHPEIERVECRTRRLVDAVDHLGYLLGYWTDEKELDA